MEIDAHEITKRRLADVESALQKEKTKRIKLGEMNDEQRGKIELQEEKIDEQAAKIDLQGEKIKSQDEKLGSQEKQIQEQNIKIDRLEKMMMSARASDGTNVYTFRAVKIIGGIIIGSALFVWIKK